MILTWRTVLTEPAVKDAEKALQSVSNKDIISLRSYKNPSYVVKLVFDAVLLLMNRPVRPGAPSSLPTTVVCNAWS